MYKGWEYWTTHIAEKNNTIWEATLNVANTVNGEKILYDISPIRKVGQSIKLDALPTDGSIPHSVSEVNTETEDVTKMQYSVSETEKILKSDVDILRSISRKSINEFDSQELQKTEKWARKFYRELGVKSPFFRAWFGDWRANQTNTYTKVTQKSLNVDYSAGKINNKDMNRMISWGSELKRETINHAVKSKHSIDALSNISDIVENAVYFDTVVSKDSSKTKMPNTAFMHSLYTLYEDGGNIYLLKLYVEEALSNNETTVFSRAYELKDIEKIAEVTNGVLSAKGGLTDVTSATNISISDLFALVKKYDSEFKPKPVNSVLLNKDGTPKVMYHGTGESFTAFSADELAPRELESHLT